MADVAMLLNPTRCTACRACQVACKQWNGRGHVPTTNNGSYENPAQLSKDLWRRIRFIEEPDGDGVKWLFRQEQCYHCSRATCVMSCPAPGALTHLDNGTVILDQRKCIGCRHCEQTCPFEVPQYDAVSQKVWKCNFCQDRVTNGLAPACAATCPTGAIEFSRSRRALAARGKTLAGSGGMRLYGAESGELGLHVMHLIPQTEGAATYALPEKPAVPAGVVAWKETFKPMIKYGLGITVAGLLLHYLVKGPHRIEEGGEG